MRNTISYSCNIMQLVILMAGEGSRFATAGYYTTPKPLITVEGKPIIAHILDMFKGVTDVTFVCSNTLLKTKDARQILTDLCPTGRIIEVPSHNLGPAHTLKNIFTYLKNDEPVIISYADFTQNWNFAAFQENVAPGNIAGAVPCYTGFHPHLLHKNLYAGVTIDDKSRMTSIKEKFSFTKNPEDSYHSSGIYYFSSVTLLETYTRELLASGWTVNGEYYVSMLYELLLRDNLLVYVSPVSHFMQWGIPEDLEEYEAWSRLIHNENYLHKKPTEIPSSRAELVKIPYRSDSLNYQKCHQYWSSAILKRTW